MTIHEEKSDFWPSFTDMLTTILLVVLLIFITIVAKAYINLKDQQLVILEAEKVIMEKEKALEVKEKLIEGMVGIKGEIINDLKKEFEESQIEVNVNNENGNISFKSEILFEYGSATLKDAAKQELKKVIPRYVETIYQYQEHIDSVIIEGHTDQSGSYLYNLELSQDRAFSVLSYILSEEFGEFKYKEQFRQDAVGSGRSFSEPIYKEGIVDADLSRRVVIKFSLKMDDYMNQLMGIGN